MSDADKDAGTRAVEAIYEELQVKGRWAVRQPRGFTWWGQDYAQHVAADPPEVKDGVAISRVAVVTPIARDVEASAETFTLLGLINAQGAILSGFVLDPAERTVSLVCTAKVYDDPETGGHDGYSQLITQYLANAAAVQVSQAQQTAARLAEAFKGTPAVSTHPSSGPRREPDDTVDTLKWLFMQGQTESAWAGQEMRQALETARQSGGVGTGSDEGVTAEFQFHDRTALLTMSTREKHATIGSGLLVRLTLPIPFQVEEGTRVAAALNQREITDRYFNAFMGGWCFDPRGFLTFVTFQPNVVIGEGYAAILAHQMALRCRWAATSVFADPRPPDQRDAYLTSYDRHADRHEPQQDG